MNKWLIAGGALILAIVAIALLPKDTNKFTAEFDRTGSPMLITFVIYESQRELQKALADQLNVKQIDGKAYGFAQWYKKEDDVNVCILHLLKPNRIDDEITLTWGHELAHCAYGLYHKDMVGR